MWQKETKGLLVKIFWLKYIANFTLPIKFGSRSLQTSSSGHVTNWSHLASLANILFVSCAREYVRVVQGMHIKEVDNDRENA